MQSYRPLRMNGRLGLNTKSRVDRLDPGELRTAQNVEYYRDSIRKRKGIAPVLLGEKTSGDKVLKGPPAGSSLYVTGDQYWLEHQETVGNGPRGANGGRQNFFHHRQGLIIFPEGAHTQLRCDVQSGDDDWCLETMLWTDDMTARPRIQGDISTNPGWSYPVVMAKSKDASTQWAVRLINAAGPLNDDADSHRFYIVLTLYESAALANGTDFFYTDGANERSWFDPGKRHWIAWVFDASAATIVTHYWQEGDASVVNSSQSVTGGLRTNGVGSGTFPIMVGRRPELEDGLADGSIPHFECGFNGVVPEFRFWHQSGVLHLPTFDTTWHLEEEIPDEKLDTNDSTNVIDGTTATGSLKLYYQFRSLDERLDNEGEPFKPTPHLLPPRHTSDGYTDTALQKNQAWLTGADAVWVSGSGALGTQALEFVPTGTVSGQEDDYYRSISSGDVEFWGDRIFTAGIRVPNGHLYMNRDRDTSGNTDDFEWPDEFSIRVAFKTGNLDTTGSPPQQILFSLACVIHGPSAARLRYRVYPIYTLGLNFSGGNWNLLARLQSNSSTFVNVTGTTNLASNTVYVGALTVRITDTDTFVRLFLDGAEESNSTTGSGRGRVSDNTNTDTSDPNENDEDDRRFCFPAMIGADVGTDEDAENLTLRWTTRYGATQGINDVSDPSGETSRRYWAFHNNETKKFPNDGVIWRGERPMRGQIGSIQIWHKALSESELQRFSDRAPNAQEINGYGKLLLSSWDLEEGVGSVAYDKGFLGNHLRIQQFPVVKPVGGPIHRLTRPGVEGIWEFRTRTPREGVRGRELYVLAGGSLWVSRKDTNSALYLEPTSGPVTSHQVYQALDTKYQLPTGFQLSDYSYFCTGLGPVLRASRGKVTAAGVNPAKGDIGQQVDHMGWAEEDRDGTFEFVQTDATGADDEVFEDNDVYSWCVTFYDPEGAVESAPSRFMTFKIEQTPLNLGAKAIQLRSLPRPRQKNVTRMRIYRTAANGGAFRFVDEIPIQFLYQDTRADADLGRVIGEEAGPLGRPPPQGARLGISFGSRALYAGVPEDPGTVYYSFAGNPEVVPIEYRLTITEGQSPEITGLHSLDDHAIVFLQDRSYAIRDTGGDIGPSSLVGPPLQLIPIKNGVGCVGHHTIVWIENVGLVFAGERGIYLSTDGYQAQNISDERLRGTWDTLDQSSYKGWHAVHDRKNTRYVLFCRDGSGGGKNTMAITWDYRRNAFAILGGTDNTGHTIEARCSASVEDADDGENRIYIGDYSGQVFEFDSPDAAIDDDGNVDRTSGSGDNYSGTLQDFGGSSYAQIDPVHNKSRGWAEDYYTKFKLVDTGSHKALPVDGNGLRGVWLELNDATRLLIIENDADTVRVAYADAPTAAISVTQNWKLGKITSVAHWGKLNLGDDTHEKRVGHVTVDWEPNSGSTVDAEVTYDEAAANSFSGQDAGQEKTSLVPVVGRGRTVAVKVEDDIGGNPWELKDLELWWSPRRRSGY